LIFNQFATISHSIVTVIFRIDLPEYNIDNLNTRSSQATHDFSSNESTGEKDHSEKYHFLVMSVCMDMHAWRNVFKFIIQYS